MNLIHDLINIRDNRIAEEAEVATQTAIMEVIQNTKQIEDGLIASFTDVQHSGGFNKERGAFNHRKKAIGNHLGDIENLRTEMIRNSGQAALQRLFNGDAIGAVLMLAGKNEAEFDDAQRDAGTEAADIKPEGQFMSVGKSAESIYKITFNLKFMKDHFGESAGELLDLLGRKLGSTKPKNMLMTDQDFITLEGMEEHKAYMAFTLLLRQLKRDEEEFAFLLLTGDHKEEEGEDESMTMDSEETPAEAPTEAPAAHVEEPEEERKA